MVIQQTLVQDLQQARRYTGKAEYKMLSTTRPACWKLMSRRHVSQLLQYSVIK